MGLKDPLRPQPTWGLRCRPPTVTVLDVISVIGRYEKREDFYPGQGYRRPKEGLLTDDLFYERIRQLPFRRWPRDQQGGYFGVSSEKEAKDLERQLKSAPVSKAACDAVFTSFAKGATNGVAYPKQVDEQMGRWLAQGEGEGEGEGRGFDLGAFQRSLLLGRLYVFIGWFLYIGLQFGGVYVVFFAPIMSQFFPEVDFYPVQTFLHTSEWGK